MSHIPQRKERNCLNCGTEVIGKYCHNCGQENIEPKESLWHLLNHFFQDMTHFDGKFFSSVKYVVLKPGFLSKEYVAGRRASYLHPIRMYLFTSAIFFLIFFSLFHVDENNIHVGVGKQQIDQMDTAGFNNLSRETYGKVVSKDEFVRRLDSGGIQIAPSSYRSKAQYDSLLKSGKKKHNWFERQLVYKQIELNEKYHSNKKAFINDLINKFLHTIPQMLFILLPLFALVLKLLYIRRKEFYYVDHVIFTLHFYIFVFIDMLVIFGINRIRNWTHWGWLGYVTGLLILAVFFYLYKAMRNFYKQRRAKTIFKYLVLLFMFLIIIIVLFAAAGLLSLFGI